MQSGNIAPSVEKTLFERLSLVKTDDLYHIDIATSRNGKIIIVKNLSGEKQNIISSSITERKAVASRILLLLKNKKMSQPEEKRLKDLFNGIQKQNYVDKKFKNKLQDLLNQIDDLYIEFSIKQHELRHNKALADELIDAITEDLKVVKEKIQQGLNNKLTPFDEQWRARLLDISKIKNKHQISIDCRLSQIITHKPLIKRFFSRINDMLKKAIFNRSALSSYGLFSEMHSKTTQMVGHLEKQKNKVKLSP